MDKDLIAKLAHAAGLDKALAEFPDDVAAAAEQALGNQGAIDYPDRSGRRTLAADARGDRTVSELHWLTASEAAREFAARTLSPVELLTRAAGADRAARSEAARLHPAGRRCRDGCRARGGDGDRRGARARARCTACRSGSRTSSMSPALPTTCHSKILVDNVAQGRRGGGREAAPGRRDHPRQAVDA